MLKFTLIFIGFCRVFFNPLSWVISTGDSYGEDTNKCYYIWRKTVFFWQELNKDINIWVEVEVLYD